MEKEHAMGISSEKFTWKIEAFSKVSTKRLSSKTFKIGGYRWKIVLSPTGTDVENFSLHVKIADSMPAYGWKIFVYFRVALINQVDSKNTIVKETQQKFNGGNKSWDSPPFIPLNEFRDPGQGFLVNDTCIIEAEIVTSNKEVAFNILDNNKEQEADPSGRTSPSNPPPSPTSTHASNNDDGRSEIIEVQHDEKVVVIPSAPPMYPHLPNESKEVVFLIPLGELIDFKSLEPEDAAAFVPLWEEVCSWHPSLIENQRRRSPRFILWAFTALGRVLHFLKTKKIRDMGDDNESLHLEVLWDELQSFGFDLTWLEPHVQSALGAKAYVERAHQMKNLRANVATLEMEMRKLKAKLAVAEIDLEVTRRDLAEVETGFEEKDMDVILGYGIP